MQAGDNMMNVSFEAPAFLQVSLRQEHLLRATVARRNVKEAEYSVVGSTPVPQRDD